MPLRCYGGATPPGFLSLADDALTALDLYRSQRRDAWSAVEDEVPDILGFGSAASGAAVLAQVLGSARVLLQSPRFLCLDGIGSKVEQLREREDGCRMGADAASAVKPRILVQNCSADTVADRPADAIAQLRGLFGDDVRLEQQIYYGQHVLITPEQARARVAAAAEFLQG